ncbi:hypothetical protein ABZ770_40670, partial [Streptomyces sp. NPDC006654]|uniref:hypothetical protein n=1 Tax=Streptomyces sp. NPDC006654 TaxID=3156897 RepID=UPI0033FDDB68
MAQRSTTSSGAAFTDRIRRSPQCSPDILNTRAPSTNGFEFAGLRDGWRGALQGNVVPLGIPEVRGIL